MDFFFPSILDDETHFQNPFSNAAQCMFIAQLYVSTYSNMDQFFAVPFSTFNLMLQMHIIILCPNSYHQFSAAHNFITSQTPLQQHKLLDLVIILCLRQIYIYIVSIISFSAEIFQHILFLQKCETYQTLISRTLNAYLNASMFCPTTRPQP